MPVVCTIGGLSSRAFGSLWSSNGIITVVGSPAGIGFSDSSTVLNFGVTPQENDIVILFVAGEAYGGTLPSGYTSLVSGGSPATWRLSYKIMGASPDTSVTLDASSGSDRQVGAICIVLRNYAPAIVDATPTEASGTSTNPNPAAITTVSSNALIIVNALSTVNDSSVTAPSGYSNAISVNRDGDGGNNLTMAMATSVLESPGTVDPPSWTNWSSGSWRTITLAMRPA